MADIKFEVKETVGVLSESTKGWAKELSLVSWNDKDPMTLENGRRIIQRWERVLH